jgi:hypothetical protein
MSARGKGKHHLGTTAGFKVDGECQTSGGLDLLYNLLAPAGPGTATSSGLPEEGVLAADDGASTSSCRYSDGLFLIQSVECSARRTIWTDFRNYP